MFALKWQCFEDFIYFKKLFDQPNSLDGYLYSGNLTVHLCPISDTHSILAPKKLLSRARTDVYVMRNVSEDLQTLSFETNNR